MLKLSVLVWTVWRWEAWLHFNTSRPRQNGRHFADDIFKCIFLDENARISLKISLTFVPKVRINNIPALVQIMAWRRPGDKPLSEPMMVSLLTHICVTRPQWVKHGSYLMVYSSWWSCLSHRTIMTADDLVPYSTRSSAATMGSLVNSNQIIHHLPPEWLYFPADIFVTESEPKIKWLFNGLVWWFCFLFSFIFSIQIQFKSVYYTSL